MGALSGAGLRRLVALWCGWLALWEVVTVWAAVVWLRWTEHLAWVGLWSVRAVLYALAARWLWRHERRGVWLAASLLVAVQVLYLLPFVDHAENQLLRRVGSQLALPCLAAAAWSRRREAGGG